MVVLMLKILIKCFRKLTYLFGGGVLVRFRGDLVELHGCLFD